MGNNQKEDNSRKDSLFSSLNFSAEWDDGNGRAGVNVTPNGLLWWYCPNGPNGRFGEVSAEQTLEDFLAQGPMGVPVPEKVMRELGAVMKTHRVETPHLPKPPTAEMVLEQKGGKTDPDSIEECKEIERYLDWFNKKETDQS